MEVQETERKYDLGLEQGRPGLDEALDDSVHVEHQGSVRLDATYFDTDDHRLLRVGMTLRRRLGGSDEGWHLKIPSGTRWTRVEVREPLGDPHSSAVPTALTDLTFATTRGRPLGPVAEIQTDRTIERVIDDDSGAILIEVADDLVQARGNAGGPLRTWRELEVEVGPGGDDAADKIHHLLRSEGIKESAETSKLATVLGAANEVAVGGWGRKHGAALNAIFQGLSTQAEELAARDLDLRRGGDEAVHDMRVASRRLRSCLKVFAPILTLNSDAIQEELRWLAGVLGAARDTEVLQARLEENAKTHLSESDRSVIHPILDSYFGPELARASSALDAALRSPRYVRLLDDLDALLDELSRDAGLELTKKDVLKRVRRALDSARRRLVGGHSANDQRDVLLHGARKAAKRARYAAEMARPLAPKRATVIAERCEEAQAILGERQDGVIATALLRELALSRESELDLEIERSASFAFGVLEGIELARISSIDEHIDDIEDLLSTAHF